MKKLLIITSALLLLTSCSSLRNIETALQNDLNVYPGGAIGYGLDTAIAARQINNLKRR